MSSLGINNITRIWFSEAITVAYQGKVVLRPHVTVKTGITGATAEFPLVNRGMARAHVPASPRIPIGVTYTKKVATMQAWSAAEWADDIEQTRTVADERPYLAEIIAAAIARRMDQLPIDQMVAERPTPDIPDGGTGMTEAKLRQIARIFDSRAVPYGERKLLVSATVYDQIRGLAIAQNRDFGETSTARTGRVPNLYGLDIVMLDDARDEGGLPIASNVRRCFAWDRRAVGLAIGAERPVEINWVPTHAAWLVEQRFSAGAVVIDPQGLIRVDCVE